MLVTVVDLRVSNGFVECGEVVEQVGIECLPNFSVLPDLRVL